MFWRWACLPPVATSQYHAPADGRARVVWGPDDDPVVELAGSAPDAQCAIALQQITGHKDMHTTVGHVELPQNPTPGPYSLSVSSGYWVPRYYGPQIVVVQPGFAPLLPRPPLFSPSLAITEAILRSRGIGSFSSVRGRRRQQRAQGRRRQQRGRLDGAAMVLVALAVMALPAIDIGLAASMPESSGKSSRAIDLVNAYNDLMRSPGAPCSTYTPPPEAYGQPAPLEGPHEHLPCPPAPSAPRPQPASSGADLCAVDRGRECPRRLRLDPVRAAGGGPRRADDALSGRL